MSCVLRIQGVNLSIDDFLNTTKIKAYKVWYKGGIIGSSRNVKEKHKTSGCNIDISAADFHEFKKQKLDAIHFLNSNFNKLFKLRNYGLEKDESPILDFAINNRISEDIGVQIDQFEPQLLKIAGELNITINLSHYAF